MGESRTGCSLPHWEINAAREKIGAGPYLGNDEQIRDSFEMGLCKELVKGDGSYEVGLLKWQRKQEAERVAQEKAREAEMARRAKQEAELGTEGS